MQQVKISSRSWWCRMAPRSFYTVAPPKDTSMSRDCQGWVVYSCFQQLYVHVVFFFPPAVPMMFSCFPRSLFVRRSPTSIYRRKPAAPSRVVSPSGSHRKCTFPVIVCVWLPCCVFTSVRPFLKMTFSLSLSLLGSLSMAIFSMISVSFWSRRSSSAPWILHNEYVIPEGTRSLSINAEGNLCCCCCCCCSSFAAVCTAAHICYRTKAAGLLDWKRPAGSDLGALAVRDRLCSEPVVMQRLEWYRWLWRDSHLRSCWNPSLLKKKVNPRHFLHVLPADKSAQ